MGVEIPLEALTPIFAGGAEPRGSAELRAAPFRGLLRFWWRALVAGVTGDQNLEAVRQAESTVFGSTELASPVVIRVKGSPDSQKFPSPGPGVSYLLWSVVRTNRQCLPAGTRFSLTVDLRAGVRNSDPINRTLLSLWLLVHLGGVGARSRRGGGSVQALPGTGPLHDVPKLDVSGRSPEELQAHLAAGLTQCREAVRAVASEGSVSATPSFDVVHPSCCRVAVVDRAWPTSDQALDAIGQSLMHFRDHRQPDYSKVKAVVAGATRTLTTVERAAFGLPIVFYYRSLRGQKDILEGRDNDRRASPLLIRVTRLANSQFTVVLTVFKASLLDASRSVESRCDAVV